MKTDLKYMLYAATLLAVAHLMYSCASIGSPSGGARDEDPPRYVRSNPPAGATNVDTRKIQIDFDEYVVLKDAYSKVVVSPTSATVPRASAQGKRVTVQFQDSLLPNTTYTIDFSNAIEDNNEGNKMESFSFTFSTGPEIDTLRIAGRVLDARNLEPRKSALVGVYKLDPGSAFRDSTFVDTKLFRVSKTDDRGRFIVRGLSPGEYRVFAVDDVNSDFRWDSDGEDMAYLPYPVSPSAEIAETTDTIYDMLTGKVDTLINRKYTRYLPNDILLSMFNTGRKSQFLGDYARQDSTRLFMRFNYKNDSLPKLKLLDAPDFGEWYDLERSATNDTLTYWIRPMALVRTDTLRVAATFLRTDSAGSLKESTDTLRFITQRARPVKNKKKDKKDEEAAADSIPVTLLEITTKSQMTQDIHLPVNIEFNRPVDNVATDAFVLEEKVDTLWKPVTGMNLMRRDSLDKRHYRLNHKWKYGTTYRIKADTLAVEDIYGFRNAPFQHQFTVKKEEDYSSIFFNIRNIPDSTAAFVELLNGSDTPVRTAVVTDGKAELPYLSPSTYYARIVLDENGNGIYDTGSYLDSLMPETVYYYPSKINLKKNWDLEQEWIIDDLPIDAQKPMAITKNKPEGFKEEKKTDEDDEEEIFDPTRNPFDPNDKGRRNSLSGSY